MIYFVLSKPGFVALVARLGKVPSPIWVNSDVLTDSEISDLRQAGVSITNFLKSVGASNSTDYLAALDTIQEHHPGEQIWVEPVVSL
jgi:hypothetical protein